MQNYKFLEKLLRCVGGQVKHLVIYEIETDKDKLTNELATSYQDLFLPGNEVGELALHESKVLWRKVLRPCSDEGVAFETSASQTRYGS